MQARSESRRQVQHGGTDLAVDRGESARSPARPGTSNSTVLRLFVVMNLCIGAFFCAGIVAFHFRIARLEQGDGGLGMQVDGEPTAGRGVAAARMLGEKRAALVLPGQNAATMAARLQSPAVTTFPPVQRAYNGPLDLDEASMRRGLEINRTYWEKPGEKNWWEKPGFHLSYLEPDPPYPFQRIKDEAGKDTGITALIAPFYNMNYYKAESARALFWQLKANGHIMIGISSYQEFPRQTSNPYDDRHTIPSDWELYKHMDGWLHCFRNPDAMIPEGVPRILLGESDFHHPDRRDPGGSLVPWGLPKKYDFFYNNLGGEWNDYCRNWTLAKACMLESMRETNATFLIVGRDLTQPLDADLKPWIDAGRIVPHEKAPWNELLKLIESCRFLMAPNVYDGSPRVIVEALCLDVGVMINREILGGWKYVHQDTGEFFGNPAEFVAAYKLLMTPERQGKLRPRAWFKENWGYERATVQLQAFLEMVVGPNKLKVAREMLNVRGVTRR